MNNKNKQPEEELSNQSLNKNIDSALKLLSSKKDSVTEALQKQIQEKSQSQKTLSEQNQNQAAVQGQQEIQSPGLKNSESYFKKQLEHSGKPIKIKKQFDQFLRQSKYLKAAFTYFCNISYADTRKKTFQQMRKNNEIMSLNRFMLFCKQFDIYKIVKCDMKIRNNTVGNIQELQQQNRKKPVSNNGSALNNRPKMMQIPVKQILRFETKLAQIYKSHISKPQHMIYEQFVEAILEIFSVFKLHIKQIYPEQLFQNQLQIQKNFINEILFIQSQSKHRDKMSNLNDYLKGSISYHMQPQASSQNYFKKPLVMHGGRTPDEMKKELQVFQSLKNKKKQSWIKSQPQLVGLYSKSRVFYKPNPTKNYQINDVLRLARCQAGIPQTDSLFDFSKSNQLSRKKNTNKKEQTITFSKIFQDQTNKFSQKPGKVKAKYTKEQANTISKRLQDGDDQIMKLFFENEKITYGDDHMHLNLIQ